MQNGEAIVCHQRVRMAVVVLRFQVPQASRAAVRQAMVTAATPARHVRRVMADTARTELAAQGLMLQLRQDGSPWSQVLSRGAAGGVRIEDVVAVPSPTGGLPAWDLQRHAGSPLWPLIPATAHSLSLIHISTEVAASASSVRSRGCHLPIIARSRGA